MEKLTSIKSRKPQKLWTPDSFYIFLPEGGDMKMR